MKLPASTLRFATEIIRDRHERPVDPRERLIMHVGEHSLLTAKVGQRVVEEIDPGNRVLEGIVWNAGLMHDLEHFDVVTETESDTPLLRLVRQSTSDGRAEKISAQEAYDYLLKMGRSMAYAQEVYEAIYHGTRYQFVDGKLAHVYIDKAQNPLSAFIVANADVLGLLTLHTDDMLDTTLRFFLERYPELADYIIEKREIGGETFEELSEEILRDYASEECDFMSAQFGKLEVDADKYLTEEQKERVLQLFDIATFNSVHQWWVWGWLNDPEKLTARLYRALPATHKTPA